eukprot:COSAG01_NODE_21979_length_877_cov_1.071979_3_plen_25_part_01
MSRLFSSRNIALLLGCSYGTTVLVM